jgi:thiamine-monophosphate kinase
MKTSEANLILKLRAAASKASSKSGIALGIGDDAALFAPRPGYQTILTCDWFLEETHFVRRLHPPDAVGWKSLARAVSDIAAMGGQPRCFLLSLALPKDLTGRWLDEFLAGLRRASRKLDCPLAGGDTTRHRKVLINITVIGEVRQNRATLRSGAKPGDLIYVSGHLGEADLGLQLLRRNPGTANAAAALKKHLYPEPRLALSQWLAKQRIATSMMDLSDGLSTDLPRLCAGSKVGAILEAAKIPKVSVLKWTRPERSSAVNRSHSDLALNLALNGGDDYELLFTVPPRKARHLPPFFRSLPLTAIGEITTTQSIRLRDASGRATLLHSAGWDPFRTAKETVP